MISMLPSPLPSPLLPAVPAPVLIPLLLTSLPEPAATAAALVVGGRAGLGLVQLGESVLVGVLQQDRQLFTVSRVSRTLHLLLSAVLPTLTASAPGSETTATSLGRTKGHLVRINLG